MKRRLKFSGLVTALACASAIVACGKKSDEVRRQEHDRAVFAWTTLLAEEAGRAAGVSSRTDLTFEDGFGKILYGDKGPSESYRDHAFRWMGQNAHLRVRRHDDEKMKLRVGGWVHNRVLHTSPVLTAYFNGVRMASTRPVTLEGDDGHYRIEVTVDDPSLWQGRSWADVNIVTSSIAFHWSEPPALNVVLVYFAYWDPAP
ncbi:MAG: hypothetical protein KIT84_04925 [Labilithrix sp.]|nr:hypothetical protein [Labilithrix sp.]MCW5810330.1 hypothetical protein [Labilithrix sp.]